MRRWWLKLPIGSTSIEEKLASDAYEAWRLKGYAYGSAFACRMLGDNPDAPEMEVKAYRWAENEFLKIAQGRVNVDEAVCGYGG